MFNYGERKQREAYGEVYLELNSGARSSLAKLLEIMFKSEDVSWV